MANNKNKDRLEALYAVTPEGEHPSGVDRIEDLDWELIKTYCQTEENVTGLSYDGLSIKQEDLLDRLRLYAPFFYNGKKSFSRDTVLCFHHGYIIKM